MVKPYLGRKEIKVFFLNRERMILHTYMRCIVLMVVLQFYQNGLAQAPINVMPMPNQVHYQEGSFDINARTIVVGDDKVLIKQCQQLIKAATGFNLNTAETSDLDNNVIKLELNDASVGASNEAYSLSINSNGVFIRGGVHGIFNGLQTLRQLFIPASGVHRSSSTLAYLSIEDEPRFSWRGLMLDVSRHFYPVEDIKRFIDYLAFHKMNVFHWHLVDNQGWRIEIKKYPRLTEVGAWRPDREHEHWRTRTWPSDDEAKSYGGYYTQDEIRDIVAYAKERFVTVVPEIEMPAHVYSALAAYPEYSCFNNDIKVPAGANWPNYEIYCAGKESTFGFLEDVLHEVMDLFPSEYIHIGGDEADYAQWEKCPDCQARIKSENLSDEKELQSYFIKRIDQFLGENNRKLLGWDEILYGGLAKNATVMYWRGWHKDAPKEATSTGNNMIMTTNNYCYFNYYQGDRMHEPLARKFNIPISKVYNWQVIPEGLNEEEQQRILGAQANLWGEYIQHSKIAEEMVFPRLAALSESLWTMPDNKNWDSFCQRVPHLFRWYDVMDLNYSKAIFLPKVNANTDSLDNNQIVVELHKESSIGKIHYELNGETPTSSSPVYTIPLKLTSTTALKAATFIDDDMAGDITERLFDFHKAYRAQIVLKESYHKDYTAGGDMGLLDGLQGTKNMKDGHWQGFYMNDFSAVIDLNKKQELTQASITCLQSATSGIYLPKEMSLEISMNGKQWKSIETISHDISSKYNGDVIYKFSFDNLNAKARYIRISAVNLKQAPVSALEKRLNAWIFIDEIKVW